MRIYDTEIAPSGKARILFAVGVEDIELLKGVVDAAIVNFPTHNEVYRDGRRRLGSMSKGFAQYLNGKPAKGKKHLPKQHPCPYCERMLRSENGVKEHISRSHKEKHE